MAAGRGRQGRGQSGGFLLLACTLAAGALVVLAATTRLRAAVQPPEASTSSSTATRLALAQQPPVEAAAAAAAAACPDRPTWRRFASWDEWAPPNCSFALPYVPNPDGQTAGTHPLFLIIGEQKGGTTFLRALLNQHPQLRAGTGLFGAEAGETHFWDQGIQMRRLPTDPTSLARAYADYFTVPFLSKDEEDMMPFGFDTTPSLLAWKGPVAWRLSLVKPKPKLIIIARDPVERYESARRMYLCMSDAAKQRAEQFHEEGEMAAFLRGKGVEEGGKKKKEGAWQGLPVRRGLYMENLKAFLLHFDRRDILVLDSARLFHEPAQVANEAVTQFLRLPAYEPDVALAEEEGRNVNSVCTSTLTGGKSAREYRLREDDREVLARYYHPHNQALEAFLGRQLPGWTRPSSLSR